MNTHDIIKNAQDISLTESTTAGIQAEGSETFCSVWPSAKKGLQLLQDIIKNPIAKLTIGAAIAAGDAVSSRICS